MILMWRSRADFLKAIQSMWQNPVQIPAASLWAVREWAVPAVEWAARQVAAVMAVETVEVMAAVVQDRVIHNRAGQCEKCGNSERGFYVPFT